MRAEAATDFNMIPKGIGDPPGSWLQRYYLHFKYSLMLSFLLGLDIVLGLLLPSVRVKIEELSKRTGQTVVMTGGSRGIGLDIVKKLLQLDYTVILGDPDIRATEKAIDKIRFDGVSSGSVKLLHLNLKSLSSVRKFAREVLESREGKLIHIQINNAGMGQPHYEITEDGYEANFQVNHLGHFLLTLLLLPRIKETAIGNERAPCHIMSTASFFHWAGTVDFDDFEISKAYHNGKSYSDSKLYVVFHAKALQNMVQEEGVPVHVFANHPGAIPSGSWTGAGGLMSLMRGFCTWFCRTTDDAADSMLYPILNPCWDEQGTTYFSRGVPAQCNPLVEQESIGKQIWARSLALIKK